MQPAIKKKIVKDCQNPRDPSVCEQKKKFHHLYQGNESADLVWKFLYDGITLLDVVAFPLYHGCWMVKMLSILVSCIFALFLWRTNGFGYTLSVNNVVG